MAISNKTTKTVRIIACEVFRPALEYLQLERSYPNLRVTYLPSRLHINPKKLESDLSKKIASAQKRNEQTICLYGDCFPEINSFCEKHGVAKVPGIHCDEMLLGSEQFNQIIEETAGTYFLEKDLILNFNEYCIEPLELYDEDMRKTFFEHYTRVVYVCQPADPELMPRVCELAEFLELSLETANADYSHIEKELTKLIED